MASDSRRLTILTATYADLLIKPSRKTWVVVCIGPDWLDRLQGVKSSLNHAAFAIVLEYYKAADEEVLG